MSMESFCTIRQRFYQQLEGFWHDLYDTEYALFDIKVDTAETIQRIRQATECIGKIFFKTAPLLRQLDDTTLEDLGFPPETYHFIRLQVLPVESVIARLDLVVTDKDVKLLEMNADTPTFIKEAFYVNGKVCSALGQRNPNLDCEKQLQKAIKKAILSSAQSLKISEPNVVFAAHGEHDEDYLTTQYIRGLYNLPSQSLDFGQLRLVSEPIIEDGDVVVERGLYDPNGHKIDILYRQTYPIEHLILDEDPVTKEKVGQSLLELVADGQLAIINPPSAFLLQSKAVLALIWGLHEQNHSYFSEQEHYWIQAYFLPTYLEADIFLEKGLSYVKKPCFGREGDTVEIFNAKGEKSSEDVHKTYKEALPVYQQFVELPTTIIQTEQGKQSVHYMYGSFLVAGQASAIGVRAGGQITNNTSYFLPIGY